MPSPNGSSARDAHEAVIRVHVVDAGRDPPKLLRKVREGEDPARRVPQVARYLDEAARVPADPAVRHEASAVRRGDEHNAPDEGQRLEEQGALEQLVGLRVEVEAPERLVEDAAPDPIAALAHQEPRHEPALAVADEHHVRERRVGAVRIELRVELAQALAHEGGRVGDRIAGVVDREPDLVVTADAPVDQEAVDRFRPGGRGRGRSVDQHEGDLPLLVGLERVDPGRKVPRATLAEAAQREVPDPRAPRACRPAVR